MTASSPRSPNRMLADLVRLNTIREKRIFSQNVRHPVLRHVDEKTIQDGLHTDRSYCRIRKCSERSIEPFSRPERGDVVRARP
jgi:hypothetical protein